MAMLLRGTHYTRTGHRMIKPKSDGRIIRARCKTIGKHINNALKEELLTQTAAIANFAIVQKEGERSY